ncbi:MAG: hypothetical protein A2201_13935 [Alicyclobacillus sp. RIFOXYA1_FULL_53_8]|nr:MAG: hypothetical protein A2201_13935 [Alicyclobacillus sp. RIFOXYA1_FULL_53_8]
MIPFPGQTAFWGVPENAAQPLFRMLGRSTSAENPHLKTQVRGSGGKLQMAQPTLQTRVQHL